MGAIENATRLRMSIPLHPWSMHFSMKAPRDVSNPAGRYVWYSGGYHLGTQSMILDKKPGAARLGNQPLRVALVTEYYYPHFGGVTEHVQNLAIHLRMAGHSAIVITSHIPGHT